jgi:DNA-binding GntR family transcriptional regulator
LKEEYILVLGGTSLCAIGSMKVTRKHRAYEYIREKLLHGSLSGGDRLSPEVLARELGISHIPVREAIGQLQSEGLVVQIPHHGTFVRQPDRREVEELVEIRGAIERRAAAQAARRVSDGELDELQKLVRAMHDLVEGIGPAGATDGGSPLSDWAALDMRFHTVLYNAAGNRQLHGVIGNLVMRTSGYGWSAFHVINWTNLLEVFRANYRLHRDVFLAVRRHDPQAARRAMAAHTRRACKNLLIRFDWISRMHETQAAEDGPSPDSLRNLVRTMERQCVRDS